MSHFTTPPESQEQRKNNPTHIPNHIGRAEQDVCTPTCWHTLFSKRLLKTRFIPLELDFLQYLLQDGLILPRGEASMTSKTGDSGVMMTVARASCL